MSSFTVEGKKVLVTGAAMGLGKLFASHAVRDRAAAVVLWDINEVALKATATELESAGVAIHSFAVDVADPDAVAAAAAEVREQAGDIDVLFNNAGIVRGNKYFWEVDNTRDIAQTMNINALAPMYIAREFLPAMVNSGKPARIVNIASSAGLNAVPRMSVYAGSKWAAVGWSDSVRLELEQAGHTHVRVTTVCPTYINTGMFDGTNKIFLTPVLEQQEVVDTVWDGMVKGEPFIIVPWTSRVNKVLAGVLPTRIRDFYLDKVGVYNSMAGFTGHREET